MEKTHTIMDESSQQAKIIAKEEEFLQRSYPHRIDLVAKEAHGCYIYDIDGNRYLDGFAGIAVNNVGHCHPHVVEAIREQASKLLHISGYYHSLSMAKLVGEIPKTLPLGLNKSFLCNSGAEAVEGAVKLAKKYARYRGKGGLQVIALEGSFHGRLALSLTLTGQSKFKHDLGSYANFPGVVHVQFPYSYRSNLDPEKLVDSCIDSLERAITLGTSDEVSCFIGEPIQGESGLVVPPDGYYAKVAKVLKQHEIPLIVDEVQTGFGRTGKMFGFELWGIEPDIVTMAKGLGGGMPIGAFVTKEAMSNSWESADHFNTFGGNPVCCAAAIATLEVIEKEKLTSRAEKTGKHILERLKDSEKAIPSAGDVRGKGMMIAVELVEDKQTKKPYADLANKAKERLFKLGVLVGTGGLYGNVMRIQPPLVMELDQADFLVDNLVSVLKAS